MSGQLYNVENLTTLKMSRRMNHSKLLSRQNGRALQMSSLTISCYSTALETENIRLFFVINIDLNCQSA
jgi:hypothetical protein